jgi:hypothetical protein
MSIHEQLGITFRVIENQNYKSFRAFYDGNINRNRFISHMLNMYDITLCQSIILAISNAQNNSGFNDFHGPDSLDDGDFIEIVVPNVLIAEGDWTMPMNDWKQLMQEWINFRQANS